MKTSEIITLRNLRHPLLVWQQQHEPGQPSRPRRFAGQPANPCSDDYWAKYWRQNCNLKNFGLAALMAKVGLFVPAREPVEIPWFDKVLADIGDEQSLQQSLSTFSGHIRRISRIFRSIGKWRIGNRGWGKEITQSPITRFNDSMKSAQEPIQLKVVP